MSNTITSTVQPTPHVAPGLKLTVIFVLATWLALVFVIGSAKGFTTPTGSPPIPIAIGFAAPLIVFFAALRFSQAFRDFVLVLDNRIILAIQAWRFAGIVFITMYVYSMLPGGFAWPAGLGDMAIGATAPLILAALNRNPRFAASSTFVVWNLLGILDLLVAVGNGTLLALLTPVTASVTMTPMAELPLLLIPVYLVPILIMLHVSSLMQTRRLAESRY